MKRVFNVCCWMALFLFLAVGCAGADDLPCPIPKVMMQNPPADAIAFTITNETCTTFRDINIAAKTCDDWGLDWLALKTLRSGESMTFQLPAGRYDILLESCTGLTYNFTNYRLAEDRELTLSSRDAQTNGVCDASVTVINNASVPICYLWMATEDSESFGGNWLGDDDPLLPGETTTFPVFADTYDLKAEDCDFNLLGFQNDVEIDAPLVWEVE